jgi:hypothetical protein
MANRKGGIIELKVNGTILQAKGAFDYSLGKPTREAVLGHDEVHGFKELPVVPFIAGQITDDTALSLDALAAFENETVTLRLNNGKVIALRNAWCTNPDGLGANTEEGAINIRFEGLKAEEISS